MIRARSFAATLAFLMISLCQGPCRSLDSLCAGCQIQSVAASAEEETDMTDLLMLALGVGGFALLGAYAALCARL